MDGNRSLLDDPSFERIGTQSARSPDRSKTIKIASVVVMFGLAGLLVAWHRGWLSSPPRPVNVASSLDDLPPQEAAEARRERERTQRDLKAGKTRELGN